ncbi:MAG TPA: DUF2163 domain-containing protein [Burkholderiaceae bacterium]|nr:DUF2163 domain-containing protein [Burkholderiaceae bacterium]
MKTVPADLLNCGTLVFGIRIVRSDATVFGFTEHSADQTVTVDGTPTLLLAAPGFTVQGLVSAAGLGVDNTELAVIADDAVLTRADILAGKWDGALVYIFRYNWKSPASGLLPVKRGSFGNFAPQQGQFRVEFRDLRQALQQNTTWVIQEACRWRLGDARCKVNLATYTVAGEVTAVTDGYEFTDTSLVQADDWFAEGFVTWLTGANAGTPARKVKAFAAGVVTLSEISTFEIAIGDTFEIVAGCRKRWDVDCKAKFDNVLNFGGEKDKPTRDALAALPDEGGS